jgi:hypothetical protein
MKNTDGLFPVGIIPQSGHSGRVRPSCDMASRLHASRYLTGTNTGRADVDTLYRAALVNPYALNVGIPLPTGVTVGVGNIISGNLTFSANHAFS